MPDWLIGVGIMALIFGGPFAWGAVSGALQKRDGSAGNVGRVMERAEKLTDTAGSALALVITRIIGLGMTLLGCYAVISLVVPALRGSTFIMDSLALHFLTGVLLLGTGLSLLFTRRWRVS